MAGLLQRLGFGRRRAATQYSAPRLDAVDPETPFVAIGDIHGCAPQLEKLLTRIDAEHSALEIICVGDLVDRGEGSKTVLQMLHERQTQNPDRFHCLMGNHEAMMLGFLDAPERRGERWMRYGGLQTLASFGVSPGLGPKRDYAAARDALAEAMGPELLAWMKAAPVHLQRGNVAIVHAAADPELPLTLQSRDVLLWGHPRFFEQARSDGQWVLHGHTIVDEPSAEMGRIAVDTGAYATGRLTAAVVERGRVSFITA